MTDIAISVQNLSKHYIIGAVQQRHDTTSPARSASLRDTVTSLSECAKSTCALTKQRLNRISSS